MSEQDEAREQLLAGVWRSIRSLTESNVNAYPAAARAIAAGAAPSDVVTAMNAAAYELAFALLADIGDERAEALGIDDSSALFFAHEDLLMADPTGDEGADLFR